MAEPTVTKVGNFTIETTLNSETGAVNQKVSLPTGQIASGDDTTTAQKLQYYINKYNAERPDRVADFVNAQSAAMAAASDAKAKFEAEKEKKENPVVQNDEDAKGYKVEDKGSSNDENAKINEPKKPDAIPVGKSGADSGSKMPQIRPNPLSKYSSYTYNISLYMINPDTFNLYSEGGHTIPKDWKLICRSGGINNKSVYKDESPRAEGFEYDVFIDNLVIKTAISSKETYSACNSFDFSFQIFEPYGFSFPTRLIKAAHKVQANSKIQRNVNESITALQVHYLLSIRFYGYDENGNVMKDQSNTSDPLATYERSFPISISGFDFKLDPKMVTYNVKAKLINEQLSLGKSKLEIPEDMTVKGETVKDVLEGSSGNKDPDVVGLIQRLNEIQQKLLDDKLIEIKDVYKIMFEPNTGIEKGVLVDVENNPTEKSINLSVQDADNVNPKTESLPAVISKRTRPISITGGSSILQVIDQIISQSSYVTNALKITNTEKYTKVKESEEDYSKNTPSSVGWYTVVPMAKLLDFDNKRNMHATEITYIIKRYEVPYIRGLRLGKRTPYYGPVKRYKHWYMSNDLTTKAHEKEIITYDVNYNLLYFNIAGYGTEAPMEQTDDKAPVANLGSGSNPTGKAAGWFDKAVGPFKTFLYSPADQIKAKIVILGDPDYLMTSTTKGYQEAITKYFGTDQSINPNSGQVFIEIDFRDATDYNPTDAKKSAGLMDVSNDGDILFWDYPASIKKDVQGVIYMVWQVTSNFSKGVFTQELKTCVPPFVSDATNEKNDASKESGRVSGFDTGGFENLGGFGGALDVAGFSDITGADLTATNSTATSTEGSNNSTPGLKLNAAELGPWRTTIPPEKPQSTFGVANDDQTYSINTTNVNDFGGRDTVA